MSAEDLLDRLESLGVGLTTERDRLRYRAPRGVLTPELRTEIQERESDLLKLLDKGRKSVHESGALGDEDHTELVTLYRSAAAELNQVWQPEIGPFIHAHFPELRKKAESGCRELDRVWRAVLDGKAELPDFQRTLSIWRDEYLEQIGTFSRHGHNWAASSQEWHFERMAGGIRGLRSDGRRTLC